MSEQVAPSNIWLQRWLPEIYGQPTDNPDQPVSPGAFGPAAGEPQQGAGPSDPDMHEPVSVEPTIGNIMGALGNMLAVATMGPLGIVNLGYQMATNPKGPQTLGKTVSSLLGLDKDIGSFQSTLGATPDDDDVSSLGYEPGLGVSLGLDVGGIMDNAVASLGPDALGSTPSPSVVESSPIGAFDVQNLDAMNSLSDKDNVSSGYGIGSGVAGVGSGTGVDAGSSGGSAGGQANDSADSSGDVGDAGQYADGGAVRIPPELAAMSREEIQALLDAQQGDLGYANGGKVPAGSHVIPADVVAAKGNGSSRAGALTYKPLGGRLVNGSGNGRSDSVPAKGPQGALRLSRDEVVVPPRGVRQAGGHGALSADSMQTRQKFQQHLGALPPPRGSREPARRNGGAFADGGETDGKRRRGTTGEMRALYADPTLEAGAYEPQGPSWGDLASMYGDYVQQSLAEERAAEAVRSEVRGRGDYSFNPATIGPMGQAAVEGLGMNALTIGKLIGKLGAIRPAPFDRAQRVAEQNATDMLGLPAGNTAAQRADAQGWVDAYHGANRLDRLLEKPGLDPKRATSGPMPYLTDDAVMASNYAKNKADTSRLADQDGNYSDWFKVSIGSGKPKRLDDAWYYLPPDEKRVLADRLSRVTESEDDAGRLVMGEGPGGRGHWEHTLKDHRGNALAAAREIWLDSANLFGREDEFLNVLNAAGFKAPVKYDSPHLALPGVLPAKVRMTNPLNTANDDALKAVRDALADAAKGKRSKDLRGGVDLWDKNTIGIREFLELLDGDIANGTTVAWTSIPDDVTAVLKRLGYDGIVDTGGKMGGAAHKVMIPFAPNQVRSRFAAFDPAKRDSSDLLAGLVPATAAGALGASLLGGEAQAAPATLEELMGAQGALSLPR